MITIGKLYFTEEEKVQIQKERQRLDAMGLEEFSESGLMLYLSQKMSKGDTRFIAPNNSWFPNKYIQTEEWLDETDEYIIQSRFEQHTNCYIIEFVTYIKNYNFILRASYEYMPSMDSFSVIQLEGAESEAISVRLLEERLYAHYIIKGLNYFNIHEFDGIEYVDDICTKSDRDLGRNPYRSVDYVLNEYKNRYF